MVSLCSSEHTTLGLILNQRKTVMKLLLTCYHSNNSIDNEDNIALKFEMESCANFVEHVVFSSARPQYYC